MASQPLVKPEKTEKKDPVFEKTYKALLIPDEEIKTLYDLEFNEIKLNMLMMEVDYDLNALKAKKLGYVKHMLMEQENKNRADANKRSESIREKGGWLSALAGYFGMKKEK